MTTLELSHLGRYRVLEELGRGAMGVVHKAEDPSLDRVVAIKAVQLSSDAVDSMDYQARFYQEAKAAGSLNHPGIITIYDTGREGNWAYIAMEFLEGVELRDLMANTRIPLSLALHLTAQVADALDYAHERGIVHRDIKPGNIMVLRGDHAKIMDFGIARMRVSSVQTQVGLVLGSPKYMSPEQVAGRRVDHRSDIFSLGVLLFEMVGGIAPFSGKDVGDLMYSIVNTSQLRPSQLNPAVPEMLDLIVAKALQKEVVARYQSAREFAEDLMTCRDALIEIVDEPAAMGEETIPLEVDATVPETVDFAEPVNTSPVDDLAATATQPGDADSQIGLANANANANANTNADATTVPMETVLPRPASQGQLLFSRRFSSSKALARLAQPSADDLETLSKMPPTNFSLAPLLRSRENRLIGAAIAAAIFAALTIALV